MRVISMMSAAVVALAGSALAVTGVHAADRVGGSFLLAADSSAPKVPGGVQGTAPHTGTGIGNAVPPAESLGAPQPGTLDPNKVQGAAPHTGTALGKDVQPPAQPKVPETPAEMKDITKGTSEGNVSPTERKMGEKPTP